MRFDFFDLKRSNPGNLIPPSPNEVLKEFGWEIRLSSPEIAADNQTKIIGDINDVLPVDSPIIVAKTQYFQRAIDRAKLLRYRPARAGEFIQLMWILRQLGGSKFFNGYFFCWEGRAPNHAIQTIAINSKDSKSWKFIFDVQIDGLDYIGIDNNCNCFFVKEKTAPVE